MMSNKVRYIPQFHRLDSWQKTVSREDPLHSNSPLSLETENDISVARMGMSFDFKNLRKFGYVTGFITYISLNQDMPHNETSVDVRG